MLGLALAAALTAPATALAHGVHGEAETIPEFMWLGTKHMIAGWDHLLFIAGIVFLAGEFLRAAKLVSLFVAGHSLTLLVATLAGWQFDADVVDIAIALSLAYLGWRIVAGRPTDWLWTGLAVLGFGLVHGVGLSTRLQTLPLPDGWSLVARVLAFNVGVEIGQLAVLGALVAAAFLVRRWLSARLPPRHVVGAAFAALGVTAAAVLGFVAARPDTSSAEPTPPKPAFAVEPDEEGKRYGPCTEAPYTPDLSQAGLGGHAGQSFYRPGEAFSVPSLQHVMGDGYIVVVYHPTKLTAANRLQLEEWVSAAPGTVAVPGGPELTPAIEAATRSLAFTCDTYSFEQLDQFRSRWFTGG